MPLMPKLPARSLPPEQGATWPLPGMGGAGAPPAPTLPAGWLGRVQVAADWRSVLSTYWASPEGRALQAFLELRLQVGARIYPPEPLRMLALTPLSEVKVVIVGQDPYHGPGQAEGLAFSVAPGVRVPPSLRNVFQELTRDTDQPAPTAGSLTHWARQGVLLLNTCLTVEEGRPASHARRGWESLTSALLAACNGAPGHRVFMLWGAHAQAFAPLINTDRHLVLRANHPSPLSARRGPLPFMGCGHFEQANQWLVRQKRSAIQWLADKQESMA